MKNWVILIKRFDDDLNKRMKEIFKHEVTGINIDSVSFGYRALGFPNRRGFPSWRDHAKEWRNRNRDRINEKERLRYQKKGYKAVRRFRPYAELKKYQDAYFQRKKGFNKTGTAGLGKEFDRDGLAPRL